MVVKSAAWGLYKKWTGYGNNKKPARRKARGYASTTRRTKPIVGVKRYGYATTSRRGVAVKRLTKRVNDLSKLTNEALSTLTFRNIGAQKLQSGVNAQAVTTVNLCQVAAMESILAFAKFYDPSNPGTLITGNLSTGGYSRKIHFKSVHMRLDIRSSYQVPMEVRVYACTCSDDTDYSPSQAWTNGVADSSNLTSITDPYSYPSDCVGGTIWNYKLVKKCELKPGQHTTVSQSVKAFDYDPSLYDNHALDYQRHIGKGATLMIVCNSVLAHDTVADQQGIGAGAIDIQYRGRWVINYNSGGPPIKYLHVSNAMDTSFTNGAVVGNLVTDNQGFSQA